MKAFTIFFRFLIKILVNFFGLNIYLKKTIFIILGWFLINFILKFDSTNLFIFNIYNFFNIDFFFSKALDKLIFSLIFSLCIVFIISKIKYIYIKRFEKISQDDILSLNIKSQMKSLWYKEVFIYVYFGIFLLAIQILLSFFSYDYTYFFSFYAFPLIISILTFKIFNLKYNKFQVVYFQTKKIDFKHNHLSDKNALFIVYLSMKGLISEFINSSRTFQRLKSTVLNRPMVQDVLEKRLSALEANNGEHIKRLSILELKHNEEIKRLSHRALFEDAKDTVAILTGISAITFGFLAYQSSIDSDIQRIKLERQAQKIAELRCENYKLTKDNLEFHNINTTLTKEKSNDSILSIASMTSSLDSDIDRIIMQNNGVPIKGNSSLYKK
jgi:hypothetical protein